MSDVTKSEPAAPSRATRPVLSPTNDEMAQEFALHLRAENKSPAAIKIYRTAVTQLAASSPIGVCRPRSGRSAGSTSSSSLRTWSRPARR